jgi:hypothetical protein
LEEVEVVVEVPFWERFPAVAVMIFSLLEALTKVFGGLEWEREGLLLL